MCSAVRARSREDLKLSAEERKDADTFFDSCFMAGQKVQTIHSGAELGCTSSLRVQVEGVRIVVMARIMEVLLLLQTDGDSPSITDAVNFLIRLEEVPPSSQMPSLVEAIRKVGDIIYQPAGYLLVDKACVETSVFLQRVRSKGDLLQCYVAN